ncbi:hypothetical protein [Nostoc punctiforme]|uniref:hypothetical protein n=1 Tax=Nostoc punctiforme TaxID=272131 RepID=UPI000045C0CB|nr:hypothetical protein [Nostoc punctiforme]
MDKLALFNFSVRQLSRSSYCLNYFQTSALVANVVKNAVRQYSQDARKNMTGVIPTAGADTVQL